MLALNSAQVSDTGRYTCVAVNAGGEQHRDYDLRVYGRYYFICQYACLLYTVFFYHKVKYVKNIVLF